MVEVTNWQGLRDVQVKGNGDCVMMAALGIATFMFAALFVTNLDTLKLFITCLDECNKMWGKRVRLKVPPA